MVVPVKSGNSYIYDQPASSSLTDIDYDVPPNRYGSPTSGNAAILDADYDVPPPTLSGYHTPTASNEAYDCPPSMMMMQQYLGTTAAGTSPLYDVPPPPSSSSELASNRSSSALSSASSCRSSPTPSARSVLTDVAESETASQQQELYDVPRASADRSVAPPSRIPLNTSAPAGRGGPRDSVLDDYTVPRESSTVPGGTELYDTPPPTKPPAQTAAATVYDNPVYDVPPTPDGAGTPPVVTATCLTSDSGVYDDDLKSTGTVDRHRLMLASIREQVRGGVAKFVQLVSDVEASASTR